MRDDIYIKVNGSTFHAKREKGRTHWDVEFRLRSGVKGSFRTPENYAGTALAQVCLQMAD